MARKTQKNNGGMRKVTRIFAMQAAVRWLYSIWLSSARRFKRSSLRNICNSQERKLESIPCVRCQDSALYAATEIVEQRQAFKRCGVGINGHLSNDWWL